MKGIKDWRLECETDQEPEPSYSVSWGFLQKPGGSEDVRRYQLQNFDEAVAQSRVKELFFWIPSLATGSPTCDKIRVQSHVNGICAMILCHRMWLKVMAAGTRDLESP